MLRTFILLLGLAFLLASCGGSASATKSAVLPSMTTIAGPATPIPAIGLGPQTCPATATDLAHWNSLLPTQPDVSQVESVTCGYLKGVATLQALITIRYTGTNSLLDVAVYDNLTSAVPTQIFKLQNLVMGSARISPYNTLLTAEVDPSSTSNTQAGVPPHQDLFREFKWSDGAGTLVQIAFPGIFPDLTRYQAEDDQAQVNQGHQPWKLSAPQTAQALGAALLHWNPQATAILVSGGSARDTQAVVTLQNTGSPGDKTLTLHMARLEGNTNGGIWIVTTIVSASLSITQPPGASIIASPTTLTGTGPAFEGVIGTATILDHTYTSIGQAIVHGTPGNGGTTFSTAVTFQSTFTTGHEEGLILLTTVNNASGEFADAMTVKVLL